MYSANAVWGTPDTSAGYMSRWVVLPFPNSFEGVEDRGLDAALSAPSEVEGVLVRAVEGLRAVIAAGNFTEPPHPHPSRETADGGGSGGGAG